MKTDSEQMFEEKRRLFYIRVLLFLTGLVFLFRIGSSMGAYRSYTEGSVSARTARFSVWAEEPVLVSEDSILCPETKEDQVVMEVWIQNDSEVDIAYSMEAEGIGENIVCEFRNREGILEAGGARTCVTAVFSLREGCKISEDDDLSRGKLILNASQID